LMLNCELAMHLDEEEEQYFGEMESKEGKKQAEKYAYNVYQYLKCLPNELRCDFYDYISDATTEYKKSWPDKLLSSNISGLVNDFINLIQGKTPDEKAQEDAFKDPDISDILGDK